MMIGEGVKLGAIGIGVGLALAIATTRLMQRWLFGVSPLDVPTFAAMAAVFATVALVASYLPAHRAAAADPAAALRTE
jgi:ABC-type antimicrobial peptide transport system permease subunit